jgi:hypothetical protein
VCASDISLKCKGNAKSVGFSTKGLWFETCWVWYGFFNMNFLSFTCDKEMCKTKEVREETFQKYKIFPLFKYYISLSF